MQKEFEYVDGNNRDMKESEEYVEICSTCLHKQTCTFPRIPGKPRLYCEEFECEGGPCAEVRDYIGKVGGRKGEIATEAGTGKADIELYMGLCVNCENRELCKYLRPNGGVWYCEEYQ